MGKYLETSCLALCFLYVVNCSMSGIYRCDGQKYNISEKCCHGGKLYDLRIKDGRGNDPSCCSQQYNRCIDLCCGDRLYRNGVLKNLLCCGNEAYNGNKQTCINTIINSTGTIKLVQRLKVDRRRIKVFISL